MHQLPLTLSNTVPWYCTLVGYSNLSGSQVFFNTRTIFVFQAECVLMYMALFWPNFSLSVLNTLVLHVGFHCTISQLSNHLTRYFLHFSDDKFKKIHDILMVHTQFSYPLDISVTFNCKKNLPNSAKHKITINTQHTYNGNRTKWSPIQSEFVWVINKIGWPQSGSPICFSLVWLLTELDDEKSCYQLIITISIKKKKIHLEQICPVKTMSLVKYSFILEIALFFFE